MTHPLPSAAELADSMINDFAAALEVFEAAWKSGWAHTHSPGHERACVTKVAHDVNARFRGGIKAWCEVPIKHLYKKNKLDRDDHCTRGKRMDLVLTSPVDEHGILGLAEFKTNCDWWGDRKRLANLRDALGIRNIFAVCCLDKWGTDDKETNGRLAQAYEDLMKKNNDGWNIKRAKQTILVDQNPRRYWILPVIAWKSDNGSD